MKRGFTKVSSQRALNIFLMGRNDPIVYTTEAFATSVLDAHHHLLRCPMEFLAQYPAQRFLV